MQYKKPQIEGSLHVLQLFAFIVYMFFMIVRIYSLPRKHVHVQQAPSHAGMRPVLTVLVR